MKSAAARPRLAAILGLVRALLPRNEAFVEQLCRHSKLVSEGAVQFRALLSADNAEAEYQRLYRLEEEADDITREIVLAIHRSFITPFDRSRILDLIKALDDTIDLMKEAGLRIRLYGITYTPEMIQMADCAVRAASEIKEAMPLLDAIGRNVDRLNALQARIREAESEADGLLDQGLKQLFGSQVSPGQKLTVEKVYDLIEAVVDRCEDVADVLAAITVEQV
jgi:predicted phosphate transport protein (TIGR00153 family)